MRQFIAQKTFDRNGLLKLYDKDYKYLCQVLRVRQGDMLDIRLPNGQLQKSTKSLKELQDEAKLKEENGKVVATK
jgi:16S rRNA (uracil1498-N3)-methyltransferase